MEANYIRWENHRLNPYVWKYESMANHCQWRWTQVPLTSFTKDKDKEDYGHSEDVHLGDRPCKGRGTG